MKKDKFVNKDRSSFGNSYRKTLKRPVEQGNIDLNNRPVVHNRDGSISTLDSISIGENGREVLIPTIVNGKKASDNDAINHYRKTGEHLGKYDSVDTANTYARALHETQARKYQKKLATPTSAVKQEIQNKVVRPADRGRVELDPTQGWGNKTNADVLYNKLPNKQILQNKGEYTKTYKSVMKKRKK